MDGLVGTDAGGPACPSGCCGGAGAAATASAAETDSRRGSYIRRGSCGSVEATADADVAAAACGLGSAADGAAVSTAAHDAVAAAPETSRCCAWLSLTLSKSGSLPVASRWLGCIGCVARRSGGGRFSMTRHTNASKGSSMAVLPLLLRTGLQRRHADGIAGVLFGMHGSQRTGRKQAAVQGRLVAATAADVVNKHLRHTVRRLCPPHLLLSRLLCTLPPPLGAKVSSSCASNGPGTFPTMCMRIKFAVADEPLSWASSAGVRPRKSASGFAPLRRAQWVGGRADERARLATAAAAHGHGPEVWADNG